jgi:hypothetical protein
MEGGGQGSGGVKTNTVIRPFRTGQFKGASDPKKNQLPRAENLRLPIGLENKLSRTYIDQLKQTVSFRRESISLRLILLATMGKIFKMTHLRTLYVHSPHADKLFITL